MPLYDYHCVTCGTIQPLFRKIADRDNPRLCGTCGQARTRILTAPHIAPDYPGYSCPVTGKWVEGRKAHIENLKRTGCRLYESGETRDYEAARRKSDEDLENAVAESAEQFVEALPPAKRERLCAEIENGLDVAVVRQ